MGGKAQVGVQADFGVPLPVIEGPGGLELPRGAEEGDPLGPQLRLQSLQSYEQGKAAHEGVLPSRHHGPAREFPNFPLVRAVEIDAPGLGPAAALDAQEGEGNFQLYAPAIRFGGHGTFPNAIPAGIEAGVGENHLVLLHARGVHLEKKGRPAVVKRIDRHAKPIALAVLVPAMQPSHDRGGPSIQGWIMVHVGADVDVVIVVEDSHLGVLSGGLASHGPFLGEAAGEGSRGPGSFIQPAIHQNGFRRPDGLQGLGRGTLAAREGRASQQGQDEWAKVGQGSARMKFLRLCLET